MTMKKGVGAFSGKRTALRKRSGSGEGAAPGTLWFQLPRTLCKDCSVPVFEDGELQNSKETV